MHHLETCLLIAEADRVLCHLVMFLTIFFHWMYKRKYSCFQESCVITSAEREVKVSRRSGMY